MRLKPLMWAVNTGNSTNKKRDRLDPVNFYDFFIVGAAENHSDIALVNFKMFCQQFANGFVGCAFYRWSLDFDLETSVGLGRDGFAFAAGVYLDVYSHAGTSRGAGP